MKDAFERIYATNMWGHGSGAGSRKIHTGGYVRFLQDFLRQRDIRSVVDLGCGDWQFSQFIDWSGITYTGIDIVESVVARNRARFAGPNVSFELRNVLSDGLPGADLLLMKDVLQHWSNDAIAAFLPQLGAHRYALITNCVDPRRPMEANSDISDGDFRPLDLRLPPFRLPATPVYSFTDFRPWWVRPFLRPRWLKHVLLIEQRGAA